MLARLCDTLLRLLVPSGESEFPTLPGPRERDVSGYTAFVLPIKPEVQLLRCVGMVSGETLNFG